ncbi:MAG TPA: hypothetical protein VL003_03555 [Pusillimonas sp.]|uniref:hypothetical protein n=1 Tax=Pusillimonas sp. TaxID=3040095 RepID=UPI002B903E77|nr:hypothetical protein [Pusillimonas sp.]HUH87110.1 hypothetical protein [Pusillimonas sp.]
MKLTVFLIAASQPMRKTRLTPLLCAALMLASPAYGAEPSQGSPHSDYKPEAQMHFFGTYWKNKRTARESENLFTLSPNIIVPDDDAPAGGTATFGWFDSGEVKLLQYVEYLPSIQFAQSSRKLMPPKLPFDIDDLPRYAMVCAWPIEDGKISGDPIKAYAEREDANYEVKDMKQYVHTKAAWRNVRVKNAESRFSDKDYCKEIAHSKVSSAAWWWPAPAK